MTDSRTSGSEPKTELQFRPVHNGLGFHPFSDGLPYAPAVPTRTSTQQTPTTGTGATAAGPARPVRTAAQGINTIPTAGMSPAMNAALAQALASSQMAPQIPTIQLPRPQTPNLAAQLPRPEAFLRHQQAQQVAATSAASVVATPAAATTTTPQIERNFGWTYPLARMFAFGFDVALNMAITATVVTLSLAFADLEPWFLLETKALAMTLSFLVLFAWGLMAAQEIVFKTTLGKRLVGLKLRGTTTAIFLRAFFFVPSFVFGGVGILWALFDRDRRCWHDVAVDLQPTRITQLS